MEITNALSKQNSLVCPHLILTSNTALTLDLWMHLYNGDIDPLVYTYSGPDICIQLAYSFLRLAVIVYPFISSLLSFTLYPQAPNSLLKIHHTFWDSQNKEENIQLSQYMLSE